MSGEKCTTSCPAFRITKLHPRNRFGVQARFEAFCIAANNQRVSILQGKPLDEKSMSLEDTQPETDIVSAAECLNPEYKKENLRD